MFSVLLSMLTSSNPVGVLPSVPGIGVRPRAIREAKFQFCVLGCLGRLTTIVRQFIILDEI